MFFHFAVAGGASTFSGGRKFFACRTNQFAFNNTATGYGGTVNFTTTDGQVTPPSSTTLSSGAGTFGVTLKTVGSRTLTAKDASTTTITGTSNTITVTPGAATHFTVTAPPTAVAGFAFDLTVLALDPNASDAPAFRELQAENQRIKEAIEHAWDQAGLPTFLSYLRKYIDERTGSPSAPLADSSTRD